MWQDELALICLILYCWMTAVSDMSFSDIKPWC